MSRLTPCLFAALLIGVAPKLGAQATPQQSQVTLPRATVSRMVTVKKKSKGSSYPRPSAAQRAASYSNLVVVIGPNGERRYARAPKSTK
jgi:YbbR domain-containing protein